MGFKNLKKIIVITNFIILLVIIIIPIINANNNKIIYRNSNQNKINIFKINLNGQITPINYILKSEENNTSINIIQKLDELCKDDKNLQEIIKKYKIIPWVEVESKGTGTHWSFPRIFSPNRALIWRFIIKYTFYNDSDYTKGRFKGDDNWINITGKQHVRLIGFTGYISFKPNILLGNFKVHDITIHGYTFRIDKLKKQVPTAK